MSFFKKIKEKIFNKKIDNIENYKKVMSNSAAILDDKLSKLENKHTSFNAHFFQDLEEILIEADISVSTVNNLINEISNELKNKSYESVSLLREILADKIYQYYASNGNDIDNDIKFNEAGLTVILVVGVNGVGKTTSIAKLAYHIKQMDKKVMLVAGDTFRSGAIEQLQEWSNRVNVPLFYSNDIKDPSSVYYDGVKSALDNGIDVLICDSAGRLQTKSNLMNELSKMKIVLIKLVDNAPHEVMLVIDANTGQNGVLQAKSFAEATGVDSIILTKMDGTSKGGIILSIREELGIPVKFIGVGEKKEDLEEFDLEKYIFSLFSKGDEK